MEYRTHREFCPMPIHLGRDILPLEVPAGQVRTAEIRLPAAGGGMSVDQDWVSIQFLGRGPRGAGYRVSLQARAGLEAGDYLANLTIEGRSLVLLMRVPLEGASAKTYVSPPRRESRNAAIIGLVIALAALSVLVWNARTGPGGAAYDPTAPSAHYPEASPGDRAPLAAEVAGKMEHPAALPKPTASRSMPPSAPTPPPLPASEAKPPSTRPDGWIYLGVTEPRGHQFIRDRTVATVVVPSPGEVVDLIERVNLRPQPSIKFRRHRELIPPAQARVLDVLGKTIPRDGNSAIWARVDVLD